VLALIVACYGPIFQIQEALGRQAPRHSKKMKPTLSRCILLVLTILVAVSVLGVILAALPSEYGVWPVVLPLVLVVSVGALVALWSQEVAERPWVWPGAADGSGGSVLCGLNRRQKSRGYSLGLYSLPAAARACRLWRRNRSEQSRDQALWLTEFGPGGGTRIAAGGVFFSLAARVCQPNCASDGASPGGFEPGITVESGFERNRVAARARFIGHLDG